MKRNTILPSSSLPTLSVLQQNKRNTDFFLPFFSLSSPSGLQKMFYSFNAAVLSVTVPVQGQLMYFVMPLNSQRALFPHCVEVIGMFANQEESRACCLTCLCFISHHQALEGGTENM